MKDTDREYLSELVTGFTDGELTPEEELILKSEMNNDTSLLDEMKHHLLVKDAVKKDIVAFTPPAEAVKGIFSALGYSSPYANKPSKRKVWLPFFKRASVAAIMLIGTYVAYDLVNDNSIYNETNIAVISNPENKAIKSLETTQESNANLSHTILSKQSTFNNISSSSNHLSNKVDALKQANNEKASKSDDHDNLTIDNSNSDLALNTTADDNNNSSIEEQYQPKEISFSAAKVNRPNGLPLNIGNGSTSETIVFTSKYRFAAYNENEYKVYLKASSANKDIVDNMSLGVLFLSKYNFKGGFEVGQQTYSVLVSDDADINTLSKNKNLFWYAASVRYDAKDISLLNITPYAQMAIGSGNFGKYMARYSVGVEYIPFERGIGINMGYEGSNLWYSTQNTPYNSSSNGFIFGLSWKF